MKRCVILGAAPMEESPARYLREGDALYCADGGLDCALRWGLEPALVVGDFDSIKDRGPLKTIRHLALPVEKDDTDTMAAVKLGLSQGYRAFLLLGCAGGRLDHTFANLSALLYAQTHGARAVMVDGAVWAQAVTAGRVELGGKKGFGLSVFPFGTQSCTVSGRGVRYPLENLTLTAEFPLGVSNEIVEDDAWVEVHEGPALIMVEKK